MFTLVQKLQDFRPRHQPGDENVRVVIPQDPDFEAVLPAVRAPRIHKWGRVATLDLGIEFPALALDFRPRRPLLQPEVPAPRNAEVAVAHGLGFPEIRRYDLELQCAISPLDFADASCVAYNQDGKFAVAGSLYGQVKVWRLDNHGPVEVLCTQVCDHRITQVALSVANDVIFIVTSRGDFLRLMVQEGSIPQLCIGEERVDGSSFEFNCYCVGCHPKHNEIVAFGGDSSTVQLVNYGTGKVIELRTNVGGWVREVRFLPNLRELSVIGEKGVEVYDLQTSKRTQSAAVPNGKALTARQYAGFLYIARAW